MLQGQENCLFAAIHCPTERRITSRREDRPRFSVDLSGAGNGVLNRRTVSTAIDIDAHTRPRKSHVGLYAVFLLTLPGQAQYPDSCLVRSLFAIPPDRAIKLFF